jgi:hypothetical protein
MRQRREWKLKIEKARRLKAALERKGEIKSDKRDPQADRWP